ncbi:hypothetical protein Vretimale_20055, partial [Volvox reticuliferus]
MPPHCAAATLHCRRTVLLHRCTAAMLHRRHTVLPPCFGAFTLHHRHAAPPPHSTTATLCCRRAVPEVCVGGVRLVLQVKGDDTILHVVNTLMTLLCVLCPLLRACRCMVHILMLIGARCSQLWRHWVHAGVCFYTGKEAEKTIPRADAGDGGSREGDTGSRRLVHGPHYNVVWRYMLVLAMVAAGQVTKAVELAADAARLVTDAAGPETEAGRRRR